jgi:hypothetical protein
MGRYLPVYDTGTSFCSWISYLHYQYRMYYIHLYIFFLFFWRCILLSLLKNTSILAPLDFHLEHWENHEKPQSGFPVSRPRFEPGTPRIRSRNVNNSTTTFGGIFKWTTFYDWCEQWLHFTDVNTYCHVLKLGSFPIATVY